MNKLNTLLTLESPGPKPSMSLYGLRNSKKPLRISSRLSPHTSLDFYPKLPRKRCPGQLVHIQCPTIFYHEPELLPPPLSSQTHISPSGYRLRHSQALFSTCSFHQQSQPSYISEVIQQLIYIPHICQLMLAKLHHHHEPICEICIC